PAGLSVRTPPPGGGLRMAGATGLIAGLHDAALLRPNTIRKTEPYMSLPEVLLILVAGFAAGGMNALAGGGTFFSFPALLAIGLPPVTANATNAVALWPASLAGAWAARRLLRGLLGYVIPLLLVDLVGGAAGDMLLLLNGDDLFSHLIPWLLLVATLLFATSPWLSRWLAKRRKEADQVRHTPA